MTTLRFITASLKHYRRVHFAVLLGVAVAAAVLTGALLVGDSVRDSLRDLTLQRLGLVDSALVTGHMFRESLAHELSATSAFRKFFLTAEPAILMTGTLQAGSGSDIRRATNVSIVGCRPAFWNSGTGGPPNTLADDEVAITEPLADELGLKQGDEVLLRVPVSGAIPADSPLGEKSETSSSRRFKVTSVIPPDGRARFSLTPSQHLPRNLFISLTGLQQLLDKSGRVNAILVTTKHPFEPAGEVAQRFLRESFQPRAEDFGLRVEKLWQPTECLQISADQLVLPNAVATAADDLRGIVLQPVVTYLANTIAAGEGAKQRKIPYSTITGVDSTAELGPLFDEAGNPIVLADDEIVLNDWAANDLQAKVGDLVTVTYYEPESTHGRLREHQPPPQFKLKAIVPLENVDGQPSSAADRMLTPELPGVTDQASISDWDLPFKLVEKVRQQDEDYWDQYRTTPKAFISLSRAKQLWPSRWGTISLLRAELGDIAPAPGEAASAVANLADRLAHNINPADMGMTFLPVKQLGLAAASGTTPFDVLFLAFSFFLIAAALMLIALLFQLGIEQRARELGTLAAVGIGRKRIAGLLSREGLLIAAAGALVGVFLGVAYAWLMITGLRTWWLSAIATPFLSLHVTPRTLLIGWLVGVAVSWLTIRLAIRRLLRNSPTQLLAGDLRSPERSTANRSLWPKLRPLFAVLTLALCGLGFYLKGEAQAGAFFGTGAATLILLLGEFGYRLRHASRTDRQGGALSLAKLAALNIRRNPGRSALTVGLVAAASFLIVSVSAFRLAPSDAGTGGFELMATSDRPIHYDLNTPEGRLELGFSDRAERELQNWYVYSFRVAPGEDASCLSLYRPMQPRVLGVPNDFLDRGGFEWAAYDYASASRVVPDPGRHDEPPSAWRLLNDDLGRAEDGNPIVPVILDASTATYSLHLKGVGARFSIRDAANQPVTLQVVGLLKNSVLQGSVLMSEANFLRLFPDTDGYRFFLLESLAHPTAGPPRGPGSGERSSPAGERVHVMKLLETALADDGFDVVDAQEQLRAFLAVQNTYLSTFQSLGALGLLLGTIGLAIVQLRSVLERRGELALMRAGGFSRHRLMLMVVMENVVLLLGGLTIGCIAAAIALIPQWAPQGASVPWIALAALLGGIAVAGLIAGWLATRSALSAPIVPALRGD